MIWEVNGWWPGYTTELSPGIDWYHLRYHPSMAWTMRLPPDEEAALDSQAEAEGRSKHEITRDAVQAYLLRHRRWEEPLLSDADTFDLGGPIARDEIRKAMHRHA
ncbi:CopG family ribbon-helix-helix protein [Mycolicibacter longobardus]